ncbi:hypothetical protein [Alicyclobacillus fodiniaquatilis]|uniref:Uncharacterized protein n=1 Tax=Alicyclobacillus fodiniaquatilis TaxID=1661150 RepID=A0ABW4JMQ0_9BACL
MREVNNRKQQNDNMKIEVISAYNEMVWYAESIGRTFQVAEVDKNGNVRIENGNKINSCWIEKGDYKVVNH